MFAPRLYCLMLVLATVPPGCSLIEPAARPLPVDSNQSLLRPLEADPAQIALEVVFVKFPPGDTSTAQEVWRLVDEQALPAESRRAAARNGFRAGVLGGRLPRPLEELLFAEQTPAADEDAAEGEASETDGESLPGIDISKEPKVTVHQLYLEPGEPAEIAAGEVRPLMQLLYTEEGGVRGRSFREAQPQFALQTARRREGGVELRLLPEIHFGQFKKQYRGGDGMFRVETTRDKETFDQMALRCELAPGEMLLMGQKDDLPGSLGHHFFTESPGGRPMRQLLLVRLRQARHDQQFLPPAE